MQFDGEDQHAHAADGESMPPAGSESALTMITVTAAAMCDVTPRSGVRDSWARRVWNLLQSESVGAGRPARAARIPPGEWTLAIQTPFAASPRYRPGAWRETALLRWAARFDATSAEYDAARESAALFDRCDRGLLELTGADRATWLHNLCTNDVVRLADGQGAYAFAIDVRGRVLFDMNVLARGAALLLDLDAHFVAAARAHLERYLIMEAVQIADRSDELTRLGIAGPSAAEHASRVCGAALTDPEFDAGAKQRLASVGSMAPLASLALAGGVTLFRHDFCGLPGFELILPRAAAAAWWERGVAAGSLTPAGFDTLDALRIEAGIPWLGRDIDEKVIPPETGQAERAISYQKGCYLGQEVIERMRSHGAMARRLARLTLADGAGLAPPATISHAGKQVGRLTSLARRPDGESWIGLGYLRTGLLASSALEVGDPPRPLTVAADSRAAAR